MVVIVLNISITVAVYCRAKNLVLCSFEGDNWDLLLFSTSPVIENMLSTSTDPADICIVEIATCLPSGEVSIKVDLSGAGAW